MSCAWEYQALQLTSVFSSQNSALHWKKLGEWTKTLIMFILSFLFFWLYCISLFHFLVLFLLFCIYLFLFCTMMILVFVVYYNFYVFSWTGVDNVLKQQSISFFAPQCWFSVWKRRKECNRDGGAAFKRITCTSFTTTRPHVEGEMSTECSKTIKRKVAMWIGYVGTHFKGISSWSFSLSCQRRA